MLCAVVLACVASFPVPAALPSHTPPGANASDYEVRTADYLEADCDKTATSKLTFYLTNPKQGKVKTKVPKDKKAPIETQDRQTVPESCGFRLTYIEMELKDKMYSPKPGAHVAEADGQATTQGVKAGKLYVEHSGSIPLAPGMGGQIRYFLVMATLQNVHHVDNQRAEPSSHGQHGAQADHETKIARSVMLKLTWNTDHWDVTNATDTATAVGNRLHLTQNNAKSAPQLTINSPAVNGPFDGTVVVTTEGGCTITMTLTCGGQVYYPFVMPDPLTPGRWVGTFFYFPADGSCTLCVTSTRNSTGESTTLCIPVTIGGM